ncbi:MAG: hypothetical protein JNK82_03480 [Myxococcaceae bacterium]|nr:hypothetical protein [Myxococcaceae bacterium]
MKKATFVLLGVVACGEPEPSLSSSGGNGASVGGRRAKAGAALTGTSVLQLGDGRAAVADPDSDSVFLVTPSGHATLQFPEGSQPTRTAVAGRDLAVVLRGSGQIARLKATQRNARVDGASLLTACAEVRGVAHDPATNGLKIACGGGELVTLDGQGRHVVDTGLELRDVMVFEGKTWATTFRSAELVELDAQGHVVTRLAPPRLPVSGVTFSPRVAWRAVADGPRVVMVHQLHVDDEVTKLTNPAAGAPYYGRPYCQASVVSSALTVFDLQSKTMVWSAPIVGALPVDVAVTPAKVAVAFAGAGNVLEYAVNGFERPAAGGGCLVPETTGLSPAPTGVGYVEDKLAYFDRTGVVRGDFVPVPGDAVVPERVQPVERSVFHAQSPSGVSCASCHPEGHEDGHTWRFGARVVRSQSLEGGLLATAPFHWDGSLRNLDAVMNETMVLRMGGARADTSTVAALERWLDALPARAAPETVDPVEAKRGHAAFEASGCNVCHAGAALTNGSTVDVGTGGPFQVPSLKGVGRRGPWLHDGCARTLEQRFDPACGGANHGTVPAADVPFVVAYLKTL